MLRTGRNRSVDPSRLRWAPVLLLIGVFIASVASPTSAAPAKGQSHGAILEHALRAWAGFPVRSAPRHIILLEGYVLGPEYGFPDDTSKTAFDNGEITPPASWPTASASSMGFPIVGASAAFKTLTVPIPCSNCQLVTPLGTTGVRLGSGLFMTDRGNREFPAWLFSISGVQNPAKVLAVGPSAIYSASITRNGVSPSTMSATVGGGGRKIVVNFAGAASGTGSCTASYTLSVEESKQAVAVVVTSHPHGSPTAACAGVAYERHATAKLEAPLGARVVVDAATEGAMLVTAAKSAVAPGG